MISDKSKIDLSKLNFYFYYVYFLDTFGDDQKSKSLILYLLILCIYRVEFTTWLVSIDCDKINTIHAWSFNIYFKLRF